MPFPGRKILITLSIFVLCAGGLSAEILTLDNCLELALKNHPNVVSARGNVRAAGGQLWNAIGNFLPYISASGQVSQTEGSIVVDGVVIAPSKITKNYTLGISANLTAFNGGRNFFDYFAARANKAYFEFLSGQTEQNLILSVKTYYFAYLAAIKIREIQEEAVKRGEEQLKLAESKFEVGSASKSDVLKAKVQYGNDRLALIDARNGIEKARADLAYMIGVDINSDLDFSPDFESKEYEGSQADAQEFGLTHYPGLLAAERNMSVAKYGVWSAWGRFLPRITVYVGRNYQNEFWHEVKDFRDQDGRWMIATTLSIPIFENFSRTSALSSAKASYNTARADYYYAKNSVLLEIKKAHLDMARAGEKLSVTEENVSAAQEDMDLVQEKYNLGAATILELLDAQVSLITAQYDKIQSEFDYNLAVATLENAMGVR